MFALGCGFTGGIVMFVFVSAIQYQFFNPTGDDINGLEERIDALEQKEEARRLTEKTS